MTQTIGKTPRITGRTPLRTGVTVPITGRTASITITLITEFTTSVVIVLATKPEELFVISMTTMATAGDTDDYYQ
jgi:hypothetical protein